MILKEVVNAVQDTHVPVVWVDPSLKAEFWERLASELDDLGYRVLDLDAAGRPDSHNRILDCFRCALGWPRDSCPNLNALKDALLALEDPPSGGWVVLFRESGALRQDDEETFEDLLEVLETVHDIKLEKKGLVFKLVVAD